jgi:hypothetical protein
MFNFQYSLNRTTAQQYFVRKAEIYWGQLIFRAESSLIQSSCRSFIGVIVPYEISKVNFRVETKILVLLLFLLLLL